MIKRVLKISRHIMWNWEKSPEEELVRYHIIVVNDKNRKGIMNEIIGQFQKVSSGIECIRTREGNVKNSKLKYLFESYDSSLSPSVIVKAFALNGFIFMTAFSISQLFSLPASSAANSSEQTT